MYRINALKKASGPDRLFSPSALYLLSDCEGAGFEFIGGGGGGDCFAAGFEFVGGGGGVCFDAGDGDRSRGGVFDGANIGIATPDGGSKIGLFAPPDAASPPPASPFSLTGATSSEDAGVMLAMDLKVRVFVRSV